ncbi:MAG: dihydropyrimidinase [Chloroflexota bacterium]
MKTLLTNGIIVTAVDTYRADLLIEDEQIALIGPNLGNLIEADKVIDASGKYIMPGGIDVHTHLAMPFGGTVSCDNFYTGHRGAAFGGTTCHVDFAIQTKGESLTHAVEDWQQNRANGNAVIDYSFHVAITDLNDKTMAEIGTLPELGVTTIKLFLAYKNVLQVDDTTLFQAFQQAGENGVLTMIHAENGDVIDILIQKALASGNTSPLWHALTRPPEAEAEATNRAIRLASMADAPVYIVHLSECGALDALVQAKARGEMAYAETCTQYLFRTKDDLDKPDFEGAKYVCSPPLREPEDSEALWQALSTGELSVLSTDHCPFNFAEQKVLGKDDFSKIPNGCPGIEDRLMAFYEHGVNSGRISLNRFVELNATNPAKFMGMYPQKGTIAIGSDADIVIWDPEAKHTISAATHHMNIDYNLYEGMEVRGKPEKVYSRGRLLVDGDDFLGEKGSGRFVKRSQAILL